MRSARSHTQAAADRARSADSVGCIGGYGLQCWSSVIAYPLNIGGKPLHSWPAFIPVTFECTILVAALSARARHAGAERPAACRITRCSTCRVSRWPAATGSSSASRPPDPKFDLEGTREFLDDARTRGRSRPLPTKNDGRKADEGRKETAAQSDLCASLRSFVSLYPL